MKRTLRDGQFGDHLVQLRKNLFTVPGLDCIGAVRVFDLVAVAGRGFVLRRAASFVVQGPSP